MLHFIGEKALTIEALGLTKIFEVDKQYQLVAVNDLTFHVSDGEIFGFLGPNGAGKTTTIRMLSCILKPSRGTASVAGHDILHEPLAVKKKIGMVFENPNLYERLTARKNLLFFARLYQLSQQQAHERIKTLTRLLEIETRLDSPVASYSKGMKQKLALVRALIHDPEVLFLDEPTSHLDPAAAKSVTDAIVQLTLEESRTVLICTHRLELAERMCDRVGIIDHGTLKVQGRPIELKQAREQRQVEIELLNPLTEQQARSLQGVPGVLSLSRQPNEATIIITIENREATIPRIIRTLIQQNADILQVKDITKSLEEIYLEIVGKRDEV